MSKIFKGSLVFLFVLISNAAIASTSDGSTPSVETICDVYEGSNSGAFGLCNAYCEAMDCGDPYQNASNQGCQRVNNNFEKRFGVRLPEGYNYDSNGQLIGNNCEIETCVPNDGNNCEDGD